MARLPKSQLQAQLMQAWLAEWAVVEVWAAEEVEDAEVAKGAEIGGEYE